MLISCCDINDFFPQDKGQDSSLSYKVLLHWTFCLCSLNPDFHHINEVKFPVCPSYVPCPWHCQLCFLSIKGSSCPIFLTVWQISIQPPEFMPLDSRGRSGGRTGESRPARQGCSPFLTRGLLQEGRSCDSGSDKEGNIFLRHRGKPATWQKTVVCHIIFSLNSDL